MGWKTRDILYVRHNVLSSRPARDAVDPDTIRAIEGKNRIDLELYASALRRFDEQVSKLGDSFDRELRAFRFYNRICGPLMSAYQRVKAAGASLKKWS